VAGVSAELRGPGEPERPKSSGPTSDAVDEARDLLAAIDDPAAVRVTTSLQSRAPDDSPVIIGRAARREHPSVDLIGAPQPPTVDGRPESVRLERRDAARAVLVEGDGLHAWRTRVVFGPSTPSTDGRQRREIVVDGWRFEVEVEQEQRARLRERAAGVGGRAASGGGRLEIRAMIPGKVVTVDVEAGAQVEAGQRLLVLEAMKMQNEVRAERAGTVERVDATEGQTVELGDLLVTIT
jgi:biotin carboxyl carrier protein